MGQVAQRLFAFAKAHMGQSAQEADLFDSVLKEIKLQDLDVRRQHCF
jgi:hypothetical protein